jgi:hypothetical protein
MKKNIEFLKIFLVLIISQVLLLSCNNDIQIEPLKSSLELKSWYLKQVPENLEEKIIWENVKEHRLLDSSIAYEIPVVSNKSVKELIIYNNKGKKEGVYKAFKATPFGLELKVFSLDGKLLKNGILSKRVNYNMKGKGFSMKEMNSITPEMDGGILNEVICLGQKLTIFDWYMMGIGGWGDYNSAVFTFIDALNVTYGGGGSPVYDTKLSFIDYNYSKITNNLNDPCLNQVFSELLNRNVYGEINDIITKFNSSVGGSGFSFTIQEMSITEESIYPSYFGVFDRGTIKINRSLLKNSSKEGIAKTMVHEILHAYIKKDILIVNDHEVMIRDYVFPMAEFLVEMYNIPLQDGILLSLSGLQETSCYDQILSKMKIANNDVSIVRKLYTENLNYGKHCF